MAKKKITQKERGLEAFYNTTRIIIDTREQKPFYFRNSIRAGLKTGDYSLIVNYATENQQNIESIITIERKGDDWWSSFTKESERFYNELERMIVIPCSYLLIEENTASMELYIKSHIQGDEWIKYWSAIQTKISKLYMRYGVTTLFCGNHRRANEMALNILFNFWKMYTKEHLTGKRKIFILDLYENTKIDVIKYRNPKRYNEEDGKKTKKEKKKKKEIYCGVDLNDDLPF